MISIFQFYHQQEITVSGRVRICINAHYNFNFLLVPVRKFFFKILLLLEKVVMDKAILNPITPYVGRIGGDGKFTPQKLIKIQGTIQKITQGLDISLQCGPNISLNDDIALQISVRFLNGYNIFLNYLHQGTWGQQIHKSTSPIETNKKFEICILCGVHKYKVIINGDYFCDFPQIIHHEKISHLSINGDISISQICYEVDFVDTINIITNNNDGSSDEICGAAESLSSHTNPLLPLYNKIDTMKADVNCEIVVSYMIIGLFLLVISAGFIYWCITSDLPNIYHNLRFRSRADYSWNQ